MFLSIRLEISEFWFKEGAVVASESKEGSSKSTEVDYCCSDGVDKLVHRREMRHLNTLSGR